MDLNKNQLIGRLTKDPELKKVGETSVTSFSVATGDAYKNKQTGEVVKTVEFHSCVAWGGLGETIAKYVKKGHRIYVEGKLETKTWDDKESGAKRFKTQINVKSMIMLETKKSQDSEQVNDPNQYEPLDDRDEISIQDIPF